MYHQSTVKTKEEFELELKTRFPNNRICILEYEKASGPLVYKCLDCGKIYTKKKANKLYENKTLCSKCYTGKTSILRERFLNSLEKNDFELLDNPNKALTQKFHIKCLKCGKEFDYRIQQNSDDMSCRFCGKNGYPVSEEEFMERVKNVTKDFKILEYKKITSKIVVKHKCGYVFSCLPMNFLKGQNCPKCKPKRSKGEQKIYDWLVKNKIVFTEQQKFEELGNLSYDFFLPEHNLLIEYQGEQHLHPIKYFGGEEKFKVQKDHDEKKTSFANKNGYTLLEIFYYDFNKICEILESSTTRVNLVDSSESKRNLP